MESDRTQVISSPFKLRRNARALERRVQQWLDARSSTPSGKVALGVGQFEAPPPVPIPEWARGARVERAGFFQHVVVATEHKGH